MKKMLLSLMFVMFSVGAYADGPTCTVPYSGGMEVALSSTSGNAVHGRVYVDAYVARNAASKYTGTIQVLVNIYDAVTDKKVDAISFSIPNDGKSDGGSSTNVQDGRAYYFEIHRATCE